jgi:CubicO group peptidase (beta-lactamase class C family)
VKGNPLFVAIFIVIFSTVFAQEMTQNNRQEWQPNEWNAKFEFNAINSSASLNSTELDSFIIEAMEKNHIPGLASCIIKDGHIVWSGNFGHANVAHNREVTNTTSFQLASISKTFTATALMQLWEDGLFGLDENINDYLPPELQVINPMFPNDNITVRMLLTHTSSIDNDWPLLRSLSTWGSDSPVTLESFIVNYFMPGGDFYSHGPFNAWAPGTRWEYSNDALALVGHLVEVLADTNFSDYCRENIFHPLGMTETAWFLNELDTNNIAMRYSYKNSTFVPHGHDGNPAYPCGWLKSSSSDLTGYLMMYINGGEINGKRILKSATIDSMNTIFYPQFRPYDEERLKTVYNHWWPIVSQTEVDIHQGLIWWLVNYFGAIFCEHDGAARGCRTFINYSPNKKFGVIMLSNTDAILSGQIIHSPIIRALNEYAYLYDETYAEAVQLNSLFMNAGVDTLLATAQIVNPNGHNFSTHLYLTSTDSSIIDSVALFDDGNHGDRLAGDGIAGNHILPISTENDFIVRTSTIDMISGDYIVLNDLARFTTIGPVVVQDYQISSTDTSVYPGAELDIKLTLKNKSQTKPVTEIQARISSLDSFAVVTRDIDAFYSDIAPGESKTPPFGTYGIKVKENVSPGTEIFFEVRITSDGYHFWSDTFSIPVIGTKVVEKNKNIPTEFALIQNYPNPFNPTTTIQYEVPKQSQVRLTIYDVLGREVKTLISRNSQPGAFEIAWDGTDEFQNSVAGGVYFCRLEAEDFVELIKLALVR